MNAPRSRTALAAVLVALLVTLLPGPAHAQTVDKYESQARHATNNKRDNHDLEKLSRGACVQKFARRHARKMANRDDLFHQELPVVLRKCNLTGVAENVAMGYETGREAVKAWMDSTYHRANLLEPSYRLLGLAVRRADDGTPYAAQVFGKK